jgi:DNA primase
LELLKLNNQNNNRTLVALHSGTNTKKFIGRYQNYTGKIFLCLDGDRAGNMMTLKILTELNGKNIKDIRPLYGISENGNQNLSEYLENKLSLQNKNTILVEQKNQKMETLILNQTEFPTLSTWEPNLLNEVLENLSQTANPSKTEITREDKLWAATMLEMDLKAQSGAIWETEQEKDPLLEHNRKMMKKMKEENIPWAESYPGELYPTEQDQN